MAPGSLTESPLPLGPTPGSSNAFDDSQFIDYDYDFDADGNYDFLFSNDSQGQAIDKLPATSSDGDADNPDKRSHPDDDDDEDEGGGKRREGDDKSSKKPGRKPLTSEPTSKRKAQNRAAQRAFRDRKEKHLKDLETKVDDLQKASESANHENSMLRAQIEKMSTELREYRKRLSSNGGVSRSASLNHGLPPYLASKGLGNGAINNPNDVNFQFEFPRFGRLPGYVQPQSNISPKTSISSTVSGAQIGSPVEKVQTSSINKQSTQYGAGNDNANSSFVPSPTQGDGADMASFSGLFSPSILNSVGKGSPSYDLFVNTNGGTTNGSRSSSDSANMSTGHNTSYSSPSASSNSMHGASSSCGTSPEPSMQSPNYNKPADITLSTIGEEQTGGGSGEGELTFCDKLNMACGNPQQPIPRTISESDSQPGVLNNSVFDTTGLDWFAQQNGNQFDPQLFGDYREPQENILAGDVFTDSFFRDAFSMPDFNSAYNTAPGSTLLKKDIVQQIDEKQNADNEVVPGEDRSQLLNCNTIWDRLQACPDIKEGEFDLDSLCKDLQKKAKCSETGAVVNESDFKHIMESYAGDKSKLPASNNV